jgi:hypothetical protein
MKRILFLTFYFRPDLCAGSFRNSPLLDELSRQTKDDDIKIDVFTTVPNRYSSFNQDYKEVEEFDNIRIERIDIPPHQSGMKDQAFSFKTYFFETLKKTKKTNYDLVYGSSSRFFTSYLAYRIAKRNNCPLYIDVRDIFSETFAEATQNPILKFLFPPLVSKLEQKVYNYATHLNLISEGFKNSFQETTTASFSYFTHGVDPIFAEKPKVKSQPIPSDKKKILYAGNVGAGQGLHKIIPEAAKQLEESYQFEVIGDGGAIHELKKALSEENIQNVILTNPLKREELIEEYHKADILFIHLNDFDIFKKVLPSKIFELAVMGKPILAGVDGYAKVFLLDHVSHAFLFEPGNVRGLLQQIKKIDDYNLSKMKPEISEFFENFNRKNIDARMANSIINIL